MLFWPSKLIVYWFCYIIITVQYMQERFHKQVAVRCLYFSWHLIISLRDPSHNRNYFSEYQFRVFGENRVILALCCSLYVQNHLASLHSSTEQNYASQRQTALYTSCSWKRVKHVFFTGLFKTMFGWYLITDHPQVFQTEWQNKCYSSELTTSDKISFNFFRTSKKMEPFYKIVLLEMTM